MGSKRSADRDHAVVRDLWCNQATDSKSKRKTQTLACEEDGMRWLGPETTKPPKRYSSPSSAARNPMPRADGVAPPASVCRAHSAVARS